MSASAKTDIQKTQSDLAATNAKLEHAMGDLGVQSGLIAHNASRAGDAEAQGRTKLLRLHAAEGRAHAGFDREPAVEEGRSEEEQFTLNVIADDRTIEKKDRTVNEPLQFYTGRDHMLYEVVVFTADKNSISGYLSTPKNAPTPVTP